MKVLMHAWRDLEHPNAGGSEKLVDQLARGMVERGRSVRVAAGGPVGPRPYPIEDAGGTFTQYLRFPFHDRRHLDDTDVVVDVANGMAACSPLWWRGPSVLIVHHVHLDQWGLAFPRPLAAIGRFLERHVIPRIYRSSIVAAVSPSTARELQDLGVPASSIRLLPNPIETEISDAPTTDEPQFLILGRMVPHKRIDLALEAWEQVRPAVGGRLVIAGDGPDRARLESLAGPGVTFLGKVSEEHKARLLAESWLLLHPALHEGWGLVITEAAASGTPTLAFDVPGVVDSVAQDESGVLVDTYDDFVAQWIALAVESRRRRELSEGARRFSEQFTMAATIESFEAILDDAVALKEDSLRQAS